MSVSRSVSSSGRKSSGPSEGSRTPAKKCLICQARLLSKKTLVWIQGVVVWIGKDQIAIDDGSGIARIDVSNHTRRDLASDAANIKNGDYVLIVGEVRGRYKGHRMGLIASTLRNLSPLGVMMESMWHLEVVDAFLTSKEKQCGAEDASNVEMIDDSKHA
ncbi:RecQ-mediated genome instability protein [Gracilaria domingensis]|nr:RecQ-mediated genome instability protein [Gracilaria domingensis]